MGTAIVVPGANYRANSVAYTPPVSSGLDLISFIEQSRGRAALNQARGKPQGVVIGSPVISPAFGTFHSGYDYILSGIEETAATSIFLVARCNEDGTSGATKAMLIGNGNGTSKLDSSRTSVGLSFRQDSAANLLFTTARWTGSGATTSNRNISYTVGAWGLYSLRADNTRQAGFNRTTGAGGTLSSGLDPREPSSNKFRIGSLNSATYNGDVDIAFCAIFSRYIADAEEATMLADIRAKVVLDGVTI